MSDSAVSVKNVSKSFKLPHEKHTGLKQAIINFRPGKKYEMQQVLNDVSFGIKKGEFFGIVGRNGSGKSTLLKLLAHIYTPDSGAIEVNGTLTPFIELGVGFNPELTGRENVFLNGALLGFDRHQVAEMYDDIVSFAEIERFMDQKLKNYSSGMQVRLAFSIAIRAKSDILLLDEVLAVGDAAFQQKCFNYFEELKKTGVTVVLVTHDMSAVQRFCSRAIYLDKGRVAVEGKALEIANMYTRKNIELSPVRGSELQLSSDHGLEVNMKEGKDNALLKVTYSSEDNQEMYVGISVIKNGVSIAEINTINKFSLVGSGSLAYTVDKRLFNQGTYELTVALFGKNKEILAISRNKLLLTVESKDDSRGSAVRLPDTWEEV